MNWQTIYEWISGIVVCGVSFTAFIVAIAKLCGKSLIDEWFARRNQKYKAQLDKEFARYEAQLKSKLEVLRISYGNIFSERISVFKEACTRMQKIEEYRQRLAAYQKYPCRTEIDFATKCSDVEGCPSDCILNYKKVVFEMKDYMDETENWFYQNEFFFSLDQFVTYLQMLTEFLSVLAKAAIIITDNGKTEQDKALECFEAFAKYKMEKYHNARKEIIASFRYTLGVPILSSDRIIE